MAARRDRHRLHHHGDGPDLAGGTKAAIQEMVDFLSETKGLTKHQAAIQLTSIAGNVAITQLVDLPNLGVHVKMPKDIFRSDRAATGAKRAATAVPHGTARAIALCVEGGAMRGWSRPAW